MSRAKRTSLKCIVQHFKEPPARCEPWVVSSDVRYETAIGYGSGDLWLDFPGVSEPEAELHVLFIGTDPVNAAVYRQKLELDGYRMTVVASHAQAYHSAITLSPDVIYLDLTRAPVKGKRALQALRADPATAMIPVVLMVNTHANTPLPLGAHDFLIHVPDHGL